MAVTAWINGSVCGQGQTSQVEGQIVYSVNVFADGSGATSGCGAAGRVVTFDVGTQPMTSFTVWDNNQVWDVPLFVGPRVFLPMMVKQFGP
jgi:hypothetical protein